MTAVVIDDEDLARRTTIAMIKDLPLPVEVIGEAASVHEAINLIERLPPELIFLDIRMRDGTGFDLLDKLRPLESKVIFTTAYDEFALKAFRFNAVDYLLKPIDPDLLKEAVQKVVDQRHRESDLSKQIDQLFKSMQAHKVKTLALPSQDGIDYIHLDEIAHLMADGNYTTFYLRDGRKMTVTRSIKEYEEILPEDKFFRVHQSYIVCADEVRKFSKEDSAAVMRNGESIPVAKRRRMEFLQWLVRE